MLLVAWSFEALIGLLRTLLSKPCTLRHPSFVVVFQPILDFSQPTRMTLARARLAIKERERGLLAPLCCGYGGIHLICSTPHKGCIATEGWLGGWVL
jgi:hypothetical protein